MDFPPNTVSHFLGYCKVLPKPVWIADALVWMRPHKFDANTGSQREHCGCPGSHSWLSTPGKDRGEYFLEVPCEALGIAWVGGGPVASQSSPAQGWIFR